MGAEEFSGTFTSHNEKYYHTVTLPLEFLPFDTLVISGWETAVTGIRLVGATLVDNEDVDFGSVKALYR